MFFDYSSNSKSNSSLRKIVFVLVGLLYLSTLPFSIPFLALGALYRLGISKLAKVIKPELSKCLTLRGHYFSTENIYKNPKTKIIVQMVFEGKIDEDTVRSRVANNLIHAKLPNGELVYPELQQFLIKWCGYYFWKKDTNFDLSNHLKYLHQIDPEKDINAPVSDEEIVCIWSRILNQGFPENKPLWEILVFPNHYPSSSSKTIPHTTILLFLHHTLGDGYSILRLIRNQLFHNPKRNVEMPRVKQSNISKTNKKGFRMESIKKGCLLPFRFLQVICEISCLPFIPSPFAVKNKHQSEKCLHRVTQKISLYKIKKIKDHFATSFSSVIFATIGLCLKDHIRRKEEEIPNSVIMVTAYPTPKHSSKLRNEFRGITINLPFWAKSEKEAIEDCDKQYEAKREVVPVASDLVCLSLYSLPYPIHKVLGKNRGMSVNLSNFSFGQNCFYFDESQRNKCSEVVFNLGVGFGAAGIGIRISTYEDGLRVALAINLTVMTSDEADAFIQSIEQQILHLYSLTQESRFRETLSTTPDVLTHNQCA